MIKFVAKMSFLVIAMWNAPAPAQLQALNEEIAKAAQFSFLENEAYNREANKSRAPNSDVKVSDVEPLKPLKTKIAYQNELFNDNLEKTTIANLRMVFENMNVSLISYDLGRNLVFSNISDIDNVFLEEKDGIQFGEMRVFKQLTGSALAFKSFLKLYLNKFYRIEFAETKVIASEVTSPNDLLSAQDTFKTLVKFDVRGLTQAGRPRADKGYFVLTFRKDGRTFKISDFIVKNIQTSRLMRPPAFQRIISSSGFDGLRFPTRSEVFRRSGYAFAMDDYNNDGSLDAFVGSTAGSTLWNGLAGRFAKTMATEVEKVTNAKSAVFVDLNNDGWKDLIVTRWLSTNTSQVVVFKNDNGVLKEVRDAILPEGIRSSAVPLSVADFNSDGKIDVYIGLSGAGDFGTGSPLDNRVIVTGLFINQGDFKFSGLTEPAKSPFVKMVSPHATFASDYDLDGRMDLLLTDDRANLSAIYKNTGLAQFVLLRTDLSTFENGFTMGTATADLNQDGLSDFIVSNFATNAQERLTQSLLSGAQGVIGSAAMNRGLRVLVNSKDGHFIEWTRITGLDDVGDAVSGVTVIDYDSDGLQDLYVTNGLWSGTSRDDKLDSTFAVAHRMGLFDMFANQKRTAGYLMNDRAPANKTLSFAGYQRNRLFKNMGQGKFIEVGYLEGVDSITDGSVSVMADINRDNKPDLVVRNNDSVSSDRAIAPMDIYQNNYFRGNGLWIVLKGVQSNANGIGAKLLVTVDGITYHREMVANTGATQNEQVAHFGLGKSSEAKTLVIKWPSGVTERFANITSGRHTFIEKPNAIAANQ